MTKYCVTISRIKLYDGVRYKEVAAVYNNLPFDEAKEKSEYIVYWLDGNTNPQLVGYEAQVEVERQ